jgi:hypothetical protein
MKFTTETRASRLPRVILSILKEKPAMLHRKLTAATFLVLCTSLSPVPVANALPGSNPGKAAPVVPVMSPPGHDDADERSNASPFGFACDNRTTYTLADYCPQMAKAGLRWLRGFPTFNVIEPAEGRFEWTAVDELLAVAARNNVRVSGLFFYNAPWIKPSDTLPIGNLPAWSA